MHELGHAAYKRYGSFGAAVTYQNGLCNSGYTHGVIEASFLASPDISVALTSTCPPSDEEHFQQWQCYHGIGHGVMYSTEENLEQSLELCAKLPAGFKAEACVNGVFMERFILADHSGAAVQMQESDLSICQNQEAGHRNSCYFYVPTAYLEQNKGKYKEAFTWCQSAPLPNQDTCIVGIGAQAMKDNITNPAFAAALCKRAPSGYRQACARGAIDLFINHHASSSAASPLCEKDFSAFKVICQQAVETKRKTLAI